MVPFLVLLTFEGLACVAAAAWPRLEWGRAREKLPGLPLRQPEDEAAARAIPLSYLEVLKCDATG